VLFGLAGSHGGETVYGGKGGVQGPASKKAAIDPLLLADGYKKKLVKVNARPWRSRTHGNRWVNTYVSSEAKAAYDQGDPLPEGALVVKESFEDEGGKPSAVPGPLSVMRKGKVQASPATGGWEYALSWERPVPGNPEGILRPIRQLPGDPALASCVKCHNRFKATDHLGGVPEAGEPD
jgi:hypothetical protein